MNWRAEEVIGQVRSALAKAPGLSAPMIHVAFLDDHVTLSGMIDDAAQARQAVEIVKQAVPGLAVENDLTVSVDKLVLDDRRLQLAAAEALEQARERIRTRPMTVSVEVIDGLARLHGSCSTAEDRAALCEAVASVPGIKRVDGDQFMVNWFGTADDVRLGNLAIERLQRETPHLAIPVKVDVRNRSAHLTGAVRHEKDRALAERIVREVPGIKHVHNELRCYQAGARSDGDARLEQQLIHALGRVGLPSPNLHVFVSDRVATLDGEVESIEQKRQALALANAMPDIDVVFDNLKVVDRRGEPPHEESKLLEPHHNTKNSPIVPLKGGDAPKDRRNIPIEERPPEL
ncbi:MAG TPA: BON domain-containing protein [Oscillatoriaceae cyanobacterium]